MDTAQETARGGIAERSNVDIENGNKTMRITKLGGNSQERKLPFHKSYGSCARGKNKRSSSWKGKRWIDFFRELNGGG